MFTEPERQLKWDLRHLRLAREIASWSKDPSTKVGALVVDEQRRPLGYGYNGLPRNVVDDDARYNNRELKYKMVVHAEANAILNASAGLKGATLYLFPYGPPCSECAKLIIQSGIRRVVSQPMSAEMRARWGESCDISELMLREAMVDMCYLELTKTNE